MNTLLVWAETGDVDGEYLSAISESCENAVAGMGRIAEVLTDGLNDALALTNSVMDGDAPLSDAVVAFEDYKEALIWGTAIATSFPAHPQVGGASEYASELGEALSSVLIDTASYTVLVFDEEAGMIDDAALRVWGKTTLDNAVRLISLQFPDPDTYC